MCEHGLNMASCETSKIQLVKIYVTSLHFRQETPIQEVEVM